MVGRFLADVCVLGPGTRVTKRALFDAYTEWTKAAGERAWTAKTFGQAVAARGFDETRGTGGVRSWAGVGLAHEEDGDADPLP